jgi:HAD superfamily hydrolase (TIGR01549 family)
LMRAMCQAAYGDKYQLQREIELSSLRQLLQEFALDLDPLTLSRPIFDYWQAPRAHAGTTEFFERLHLPICMVSNIDDADLQAAIGRLGWNLPLCVTSQTCRAYKPRPEMFMAALERLSLRPHEVVHIGDSLSSDVAGARGAGIDVVWLNRRLQPATGVGPTFQARNLDDVLQFMNG